MLDTPSYAVPSTPIMTASHVYKSSSLTTPMRSKPGFGSASRSRNSERSRFVDDWAFGRLAEDVVLMFIESLFLLSW